MCNSKCTAHCGSHFRKVFHVKEPFQFLSLDKVRIKLAVKITCSFLDFKLLGIHGMFKIRMSEMSFNHNLNSAPGDVERLLFFLVDLFWCP